MEIKMPAVFLCFDDVHVAEWHDCRQFFLKHGIRAAFYVTLLQKFTGEDWRRLAELEADGHTIAFHGLNHVRAGEAVGKIGCGLFLQEEIFPGLKIMEEHGFRPRHYSYPRGNRTDKSDRCLLGVFDTLRAGGGRLYTAAELREHRVLMSLNFGKRRKERYCGHEGLLNVARMKGKAVIFYMHQPVKHRLEYLSGLRKHINFYPMGALDRP